MLMTPAINQYIVRRFYAVIDQDSMQAADPLLADNFLAQVVGFDKAMNRQAYKRFSSLFFSAEG
jgi:hypothetical protein